MLDTLARRSPSECDGMGIVVRDGGGNLGHTLESGCLSLDNRGNPLLMRAPSTR